METTITKAVKGATMNRLFAKSNEVNIRYFKALNLKNDNDYNPKRIYNFEITIRHPEGTDAKQIFKNAAVKKGGSNV